VINLLLATEQTQGCRMLDKDYGKRLYSL